MNFLFMAEAVRKAAAVIVKTLALQPDATAGADNWMLDIQATTNNATSNLLQIGESYATPTDRDYYRALIKFDLSSIPATAIILHADIEFTLLLDGNQRASVPGYLYPQPLLRAWIEDQSNWNVWKTGSNWQTAGAGGAQDAEALSIGFGEFAVADLAGAKKTITLTPLSVQRWTSGALANNGLLLKMLTELNDAYRVASSDHATAEYRPKITLNYCESATGLRQITFAGDSKSNENDSWPSLLLDALRTAAGVPYYENPQRLAVAGYTIGDLLTYVTANLGAQSGNPVAVLLNIGANDLADGTSEANFKGRLVGIIDLYLAKFPSTIVYVAYPWRTGYDAGATAMKGWIDAVIARYDGVHVRPGQNENGWYKTGVATMSIDGIHYNAAGAAACKDQWLAIINGTYSITLNGAWSWFTNPRAVSAGGYNFFGGVDQYGDVWISDGTIRKVLHVALEIDDHDNPSILIRSSDNRIVVWYCKHNGDELYQRISTNPLDISSFGTEVNIDSSLLGATYAYPNPIQLTGEANSPIYLFYRADTGGNVYRDTYFSKSLDGGATWSAQTALFQSTDQRPYFQITRNGTNRIDFAITDGHPNEVATNSIYHFYYQGGNYYKSDGTLIGDSSVLPLTPAMVTKVYDGTTNRAWVWDIAIDGAGYPVIAYTNFISTSDHRYRYARWTGSAWVDNEIVAGGGYLYAAEAYYSGGICLDKSNPNIVYVSRVVSGQWEIYKYTTANNGVTWDAGTAITSASSSKNIRPYVAGSKLYWPKGVYTAYTDFVMNISNLSI